MSLGYDTRVDILYRGMVEYFNNPNMTKIKNVHSYSVYMTKTYCLLSKECRYLIAMVPINDLEIGTTKNLDELFWVSFQTRTLAELHELPPHSYTTKRGGPLDTKIVLENRTDNATKYTCERFPITVTLLSAKSVINEYQAEGTIIAALETYQTIISLIE